MPYREIHHAEPETDPELVAALAEELRQGRQDGPADAPLIIQEDVPRTPLVHVTVIWDRWAEVGPQTRGRIIMDAYHQVRGDAGVRAITIALGLTHQQAQKLGVKDGLARAMAGSASS